MSSFYCEKCNTLIIDTPAGYITGCKHHPLSLNLKRLKEEMMMEEAISSAELAGAETEKWEKDYDNIFGEKHYIICEGKKCQCHIEVKNFIRQLIIDEYRRGYNQAIKDFKIKNEFGEKNL